MEDFNTASDDTHVVNRRCFTLAWNEGRGFVDVVMWSRYSHRIGLLAVPRHPTNAPPTPNTCIQLLQ